MVTGWITAALLAACWLGEWLHAPVGPPKAPGLWPGRPAAGMAVGRGAGARVGRGPFGLGPAGALGRRSGAVGRRRRGRGETGRGPPPGHRAGRFAEHATARRGAVGHATAVGAGPPSRPLDPRPARLAADVTSAWWPSTAAPGR